ncbi:MAG: hypothetical protein ACOYXM_16155 [Actinomycetota bacterium]
MRRTFALLAAVAVLGGCGGGDDEETVDDRRKSNPELFELDHTAEGLEEQDLLSPDEIDELVEDLRDAMEEEVVEACDDAEADEDFTGAARDVRTLVEQAEGLGSEVSSGIASDLGEMLRGICPEQAEDIVDEL